MGLNAIKHADRGIGHPPGAPRDFHRGPTRPLPTVDRGDPLQGSPAVVRWLLDEGEIDRNPMERMRPPKLDERPVPVIPDDTIRKLLATCSGRTFEDRRDTAILFVLIDTGARLSEVADLRLDEDLDLEFDELHVISKGRRGRTLPLGRSAMKAMDRYLRARVRHKDEELHWLWVGPRGPSYQVGHRADASAAVSRSRR